MPSVYTEHFLIIIYCTQVLCWKIVAVLTTPTSAATNASTILVYASNYDS